MPVSSSSVGRADHRREDQRARRRGRQAARDAGVLEGLDRRGRGTPGPEPASAVAASNSRSSSVTTVPSCSSQPSTRASASEPVNGPFAKQSVPEPTLTPDVRHAAEERHALLEHVLERRRRDAGGDRDDGGAGVDQLRGLAQHALDVDRLDGDQQDVGAAHELGVVGDVLRRRGARPGAPPGPSRDRSTRMRSASAGIGAQPALDHRAGHVAGADRAQYGRGVHASDGTCGRLAGTQARGVTLRA